MELTLYTQRYLPKMGTLDSLTMPTSLSISVSLWSRLVSFQNYWDLDNYEINNDGAFMAI